MFALVLGMLLCLGLGVAVVCMVALPARRDGRGVLTPKGDDLVSAVREKTGSAVDNARERTTGALDAARDKGGDVTRLNEH